MIDILFYVLAAVTLPISAIVITHYVSWSLDRDLKRSQAERQRVAEGRR